MKTSVRYLTPLALSQRWEGVITINTLANWRSAKIGPAFVKIGGKVLYDDIAILAWERKHTSWKKS